MLNFLKFIQAERFLYDLLLDLIVDVPFSTEYEYFIRAELSSRWSEISNLQKYTSAKQLTESIYGDETDKRTQCFKSFHKLATLFKGVLKVLDPSMLVLVDELLNESSGNTESLFNNSIVDHLRNESPENTGTQFNNIIENFEVDTAEAEYKSQTEPRIVKSTEVSSIETVLAAPGSASFPQAEIAFPLRRREILPWTVKREMFDNGTMIGRGQSATVYRVRHCPSAKVFVLKVILKKNIYDRNDRWDASSSAIVQSSSCHDNIARLYDICETKQSFGYIMENVKGRTLYEILDQHKSLAESTAACYATQIRNGLAHLHEQDFAHTTLYPENIMVTSSGLIKLIGFSKATHVCWMKGRRRVIHSDYLEYLAPELILEQEVADTRVLDCWTLGIIIHEMITGATPFVAAGSEALRVRILSDEVPKEGLSEAAYSLVCMLLTRDPIRRSTVQGFLAHTWVTKYAGQQA